MNDKNEFEPKCIKPILSPNINNIKFNIFEMNHEFAEAEKFCHERQQFLLPIEDFGENFLGLMEQIGREISDKLSRDTALRFWTPLKRSSDIAGKVDF